MSAKILKGTKVSRALREELKGRAAKVTENRGSPPHLAILSIGGDASSKIFLKRKLEMCRVTGIACTVEALPETIKDSEVLRILAKLGKEVNIDGIIIDLPIPGRLDARRIADAIAHDKDVEGVSTVNFGHLFWEKSFSVIRKSNILIPCTAIATIQLLLESGVDPRGKTAVVVGRSNIVGKPTAHLLSCLDATVTLCHSHTTDLKSHVRAADIVVSAVGKPRYIKKSWIKPGAVVLDVGVYSEAKTLCGDVDFENVRKVAGYITPVPGGIGPLTVAFLLYNTVISAENRTRRILDA